ncbi:MAG: penicillin-binding protein 2 [Crocinitomicaceae bacterium]|nr:penicillin-binding protein 2 [Crocinitomicaceae bacterium]MBK8927821.1 penicillin-binding protein 2 [Crocinitomicaceae bacterium]
MNNDSRKYIIALMVILVSFIFLVRLFYMQVIDDQWKDRAAEISENKVITQPARGVVYDRNGEKLISNVVYYDLRVVPNQAIDIDSVSLVKLLDISMDEYVKKMNAARKYSKRKASDLVTQIPPDEFSLIAPELYKYPGIFEAERTLRVYPKKCGAHVLGYMNEVNDEDIGKNPYYKSGDFIGRMGIERSYEELLRGKRGVKYYLQDAIGVETGRYENGKYDTLAEQGKSISLGIDWELQAYGERLFQNKLGCVVAIEPESGEILAMVSAPTYDPNLLVGRRLGENYTQLHQDTLLPLYNRALGATYPPGSTFKLIMALIAMQEGVITPESGFPCNKNLVGCHNHGSAGSVSDAVKMSCNPYFYQITKRIIHQGKSTNGFKDAAIGLEVWTKYVKSFGIGSGLNVDFPGHVRGYVPDVAFYDNYHGQYRWQFESIYSIAIGQGEVLVTSLEMANLACIIANRGYYHYPHFIKSIDGGPIPDIYYQKNYCMVDSQWFAPIIDGMYRVVHEPGGTGSRAKLDSIAICGKTGTAENFKRINGVTHQMTDHSIFTAFAPMDNPKIAIYVYIENTGFGGTWAAPLASLMIEKYLTGTVSDTVKENRILNANLIPDASDILPPKQPKKRRR